MKRKTEQKRKKSKKVETDYNHECIYKCIEIDSEILKLGFNPRKILQSLLVGLNSRHILLSEFCERCLLWVMDKNLNLIDGEWEEIEPIVAAEKNFFVQNFEILHKKSFLEVLKRNQKKKTPKWGMFETSNITIPGALLERSQLNLESTTMLESRSMLNRELKVPKPPTFNELNALSDINPQLVKSRKMKKS